MILVVLGSPPVAYFTSSVSGCDAFRTAVWDCWCCLVIDTKTSTDVCPLWCSKTDCGAKPFFLTNHTLTLYSWHIPAFLLPWPFFWKKDCTLPPPTSHFIFLHFLHYSGYSHMLITSQHALKARTHKCLEWQKVSPRISVHSWRTMKAHGWALLLFLLHLRTSRGDHRDHFREHLSFLSYLFSARYTWILMMNQDAWLEY